MLKLGQRLPSGSNGPAASSASGRTTRTSCVPCWLPKSSAPARAGVEPFEFSVTISLAVTRKSGLIVGARSFPGNPYDGHTLASRIEQTNVLLQVIGVKPTTAIVDFDYRGVD